MGRFRPQNPGEEAGFKPNREVAGVPLVQGATRQSLWGTWHLTPSYAAVRTDPQASVVDSGNWAGRPPGLRTP